MSLRLQATKFHLRSKERPFVRGRVYLCGTWLLREARLSWVKIDARFVLYLTVKIMERENIVRFYAIAFPPKVLYRLLSIDRHFHRSWCRSSKNTSLSFVLNGVVNQSKPLVAFKGRYGPKLLVKKTI